MTSTRLSIINKLIHDGLVGEFQRDHLTQISDEMFEEFVANFNPHHDKGGRFASGSGGGGGMMSADTGGGSGGSGGKKLPKVTPMMDNILSNIDTTGQAFPKGTLASASEKNSLAKASKDGLLKQKTNDNGSVVGYELTDLGKSVLGTSKSSESKSTSFGDQVKKNAAAASKVKGLF